MRAVYHGLRELVFVRNYSVFCAAETASPGGDTGGRVSLTEVTPSKYRHLRNLDGRDVKPADEIETGREHRCLGLVDEKDQIACYGWASGARLGQVGEGGAVLVPFEGGLTIELEPDEIYLWDYWTRPEHRRRGAYRRLLTLVRKWADGFGAGRITIYCRSDNHASSAGIVAAGFTLVDHIRLWRFFALRLLHSPKLGWRVWLAGGRFTFAADSSCPRLDRAA